MQRAGLLERDAKIRVLLFASLSITYFPLYLLTSLLRSKKYFSFLYLRSKKYFSFLYLHLSPSLQEVLLSSSEEKGRKQMREMSFTHFPLMSFSFISLKSLSFA